AAPSSRQIAGEIHRHQGANRRPEQGKTKRAGIEMQMLLDRGYAGRPARAQGSIDQKNQGHRAARGHRRILAEQRRFGERALLVSRGGCTACWWSTAFV